jgi:hypothetical protein
MKFVVLVLVEIMITVIGVLITTRNDLKVGVISQSNSTAGLRFCHGSIYECTEVYDERAALGPAHNLVQP